MGANPSSRKTHVLEEERKMVRFGEWIHPSSCMLCLEKAEDHPLSQDKGGISSNQEIGV